MSLINDALKRARQTQQKNSPPPAPGALLRTVEAASPRTSRPGRLLPLAVAAVLVMVFVVWWAVSRDGTGKNVAPVTTEESEPSAEAISTASTPTPTATQPQPEPAPATIVTPAVSPSDAPATSAPPPAIASSPVVPPPATTTTPAVVAEALPAAPAWPKLQGIFYRPDRPSALLNGKTVLIGERSGEFLVVAVDRQSVTLVRAGATNVLRLAK